MAISQGSMKKSVISPHRKCSPIGTFARQKARRDSRAKGKRVSIAARAVVGLFERTSKLMIHYGHPPEFYPAIRKLKNALDDSRPRRPRSKKKVKA